MAYSETVLEHFHAPRNVGEMDAPHGFAREENPVCGDVVEMWVRLDQDRVEQVQFRVFGCVATTAACSFLSEWARSRRLDEVRHFQPGELVEALGGLPRSKRHGASVALQAIWKALDSCERR